MKLTTLFIIAPLLLSAQFKMDIQVMDSKGSFQMTDKVSWEITKENATFNISDTTIMFDRFSRVKHQSWFSQFNAIERSSGDKYQLTYSHDKEAGQFTWLITNQEGKTGNWILLKFNQR